MNEAAKAQDMPMGGKEEVLSHVVRDLNNRAEMGKEKYGTTLQTFNGRSALLDAYQEALDLVMYLKQELLEQEETIPEKRFKIAFDLDDVVLNTAPEILNNLHYYGFYPDPFEEVVNFDLINFTGASKGQLDQIIEESLWKQLPLINSFTPEIFYTLKQKGVEIYIVSHRGEEFREHIINNLNELEVVDSYYQLVLIPGYIPNTNTPDKAKFCADSNIDIIIDDRLDTLCEIRYKADTKPVVFDRPWNRKPSFTLNRIYYLDEILEFVE